MVAHPEGLDEHALLSALSAEGIALFDREQRTEPIGLFRIHFILFHALYVLRDRLRSRRESDLEIHCLRIALVAYEEPVGHSQLAEPDPLRSYYLDLRHLREMTPAGVREMLDAFWLRMSRRDRRRRALEVLGLSDPVDDATIKRTYRELAMRHHPDRGGEERRLQEINAAMTLLRS